MAYQGKLQVVSGPTNITTQNLVPAGTATANSAVEIILQGASALTVQVTGTYTGALSLQATLDGTNWVTLSGAATFTSVAAAQTATIASAAVGIFQAEVAGYVRARVTALAAVTGTAAVTLTGSLNPGVIGIDTAIPTGANVIGAVTQSGTWNIGTLTGTTALTPGTAAANLGKAEDAVHASGDTGVMALAVRTDTPATTASATGDYVPALTDNLGRIWTNGVYANTIDAAHTHFRNTGLTSTAVAVKAAAGNLYGFTFLNPNTTAVYVKMYNTAQGSVTVGTTAIVKVFAVPPGDANGPGILMVTPDETPMYYASTAITIAVVTGIADNSTTAPGTAIYAEVIYK